MARIFLFVIVLGLGSNVDLALSQDQGAQAFRLSAIWVQTRSAAENILLQLQSGADFSELARKYSVDPGIRDNLSQKPGNQVGKRRPCCDSKRHTSRDLTCRTC